VGDDEHERGSGVELAEHLREAEGVVGLAVGAEAAVDGELAAVAGADALAGGVCGVGGEAINAKGLHELYQGRIAGWARRVLVLAAAVTIIVAVFSSPAGPILGDYFSATWRTVSYWFTGLFH
jgi:uncharacterized membrane-anchored protein